METRWTDELAHPALLPDEVHVWRASIPAAAAVADALHGLLDDDDRARAARFRFDCDRRAFVFRWAALRMVLAGYLEADPSQLRFRRAPAGKPFLAHPFDSFDIRFSLARSSSTAVFAIARARNVGVDLERVRRNVDVMAMALQGYGLLKLTGRGEGLEPLRQQLGERFAKGPRQPQQEPGSSPQLARAA